MQTTLKLPIGEYAKNRGKGKKEGRKEFRSLRGSEKRREKLTKEGKQKNRSGIPRKVEMTQEENGGKRGGSRGVEIVEKSRKPSDESGNRGGEKRLAGREKRGENGAGVFERRDEEILGFGGSGGEEGIMEGNGGDQLLRNGWGENVFGDGRREGGRGNELSEKHARLMTTWYIVFIVV